MCGGEMTTVPGESWRQMSVDNGYEIDNGIKRWIDIVKYDLEKLRWWTQRIVINGEESVWVTLTRRIYIPKERDRDRDACLAIPSQGSK